MEHMAIIVDGTDRPAEGGDVGFPLGAIRQPGRPLAGLALAIATAIVAIGAVGPHLADGDSDAASACAAPAGPALATRPGAGTESRTPPPTEAAASPTPWWLLSRVAEWVDPATGRSMQAQVDHAPRIGNGRHFIR